MLEAQIKLITERVLSWYFYSNGYILLNPEKHSKAIVAQLPKIISEIPNRLMDDTPPATKKIIIEYLESILVEAQKKRIEKEYISKGLEIQRKFNNSLIPKQPSMPRWNERGNLFDNGCILKDEEVIEFVRSHESIMGVRC